MDEDNKKLFEVRLQDLLSHVEKLRTAQEEAGEGLKQLSFFDEDAKESFSEDELKRLVDLVVSRTVASERIAPYIAKALRILEKDPVSGSLYKELTLLDVLSGVESSDILERRTDTQYGEILSLAYKLQEEQLEDGDTHERKTASRTKAKELGVILGASSASYPSNKSGKKEIQEFQLRALTMDAMRRPKDESAISVVNGKVDPLYRSAERWQLVEETRTVNIGFLGVIHQRVKDTLQEDPEAEFISFHVPTTLNAMKVDYRPTSLLRESRQLAKSGETPSALERAASVKLEKWAKLYDLASPLVGCYGITDDGQYLVMLSPRGYDPETETATFYAPYFFGLVKSNPQNYVVHFDPSIANERDQAALEIAIRLRQGLATLGKKSKKTAPKTITKTTEKDGISQIVETKIDGETNTHRTYNPSYRFLIDRCPEIRNQLKEIEESEAVNKRQMYNNRLGNVFRNAVRILLEKSDVLTTYKNFTVNGYRYNSKTDKVVFPDTPTKTTLKKLLVIEYDTE